jgi:signal transduction histidine kinase
LEERLQGIVELLPPAWQYPELASARMEVDGQQYRSSAWELGTASQRATIVSNQRERGFIEVVYATEMPDADEGPFLAEERSLIDSVASQVALVIEHWEADEEKEKLQDQVRHADRLATIGELAAVVAHELNEPLVSILGFARLVQKSRSIPERIREDIALIVAASLHAREIIKKLTAFARRRPPRRTSVDLSRVVKDGLFLVESRCVRERINLRTLLESDLPPITADGCQIQQVLVNLAVNGIQAMPSGGTLTVQTARNGEHLLLIVEDNGIGMSEDVKQRVFLPFFTTKEVGKGTGLGLSVVHGIVTAHGGSIQVESQPGQGSRFEVRLPLTNGHGAQVRG